MKQTNKTIIIFAIFFSSAANVYSQYFIEGSLSVGYRDQKFTENNRLTENPSTSSIYVAPKVGYWLNNRIAVGVKPYFAADRSKQIIPDPDNFDREIKSELKVSAFGFAVFGRYKLFSMRRFSVLTDGTIGVARARGKETLPVVTNKTLSGNSFDIEVLPLISYDLNDKYSFIAALDCLRLGFSSYTNKRKGEIEEKYTINTFSFLAQSTIFSYLSDISIGFLYKF